MDVLETVGMRDYNGATSSLALGPEMAVVLATEWQRTDMYVINCLHSIGASLVVVGLAVNIYIAASKSRIEEVDILRSECDFHSKLHHFLSDMEAEVKHHRLALELRIARLDKAEVLQCLLDVRKEVFNRPMINHKSYLEAALKVCNDVDLVLRAGLNIPTPCIATEKTTKQEGSAERALYQTEDHKPIDNEKWYDLWDYMKTEAGEE